MRFTEPRDSVYTVRKGSEAYLPFEFLAHDFDREVRLGRAPTAGLESSHGLVSGV